MVKPETVEEARSRFGADVIYAAPHAEEASGRNAIPRTMARYYAQATGASTDTGIVQSVRAFHTGANAIERLISRPLFDGPVEAGRRYVLVDDATVLGGTLAEMANHIRAGGGEVAGVVTLVNASRRPHNALQKTRARLVESRFGDVIRQELGVESASLTDAAGFYLANFRNADSLRDRIVAARRQASGRRGEEGLRPPAPEDGGRLRTDTAARGPLRATLNFTPEWDARREAVYADLRAALDRMGLAGVNLRLPDRLETNVAAEGPLSARIRFSDDQIRRNNFFL
jgi:hypothetical protein